MNFLKCWLFLVFFSGSMLVNANSGSPTKTCTQFPDESDTLVWTPDLVVTWDDFWGKPNKDSPFAALTRSGIRYAMDYRITYAVITVQAYMNRARSWVKEEGRDKDILKHEYYHFCVTELFARKLRKEISKYRGPDYNLSSFLTKKFATMFKSFANYQNAYDKGTDHSTRINDQHKWEIKIDQDLKKMSTYAEQSVIVYFR